MATAAQWLEGTRPRTYPNAISPVIAGSGAAVYVHGFSWWKALLALVVAVALIIGVNFANDYSDGVRGTDDERVGPLRLVGSKLASPAAVRNAAVASLALAAIAGVVLALTSSWWLIVVGAVCLAGAWFYTGGSKPYGYLGFGEIAVFVFFGLIAVLGTLFTQSGQLTAVGWAAAVAVGSFSSAVLVANNLRDIPTDQVSGKITLAVRLGDGRTRALYLALALVPLIVTLALVFATWWALLALLAAPLVWRAATPIRSGATGLALIPVLRDTGLAMAAWSILVTIALAIAS